MATAKKSRGKAGSRAKKPMMKKSGAKKQASAKKAAKPAAKSAAKRGPQRAAKKSAPKKAVAIRGPAKKKSGGSKSTTTKNPLSRVARVAKEIAHQTTVAVSEGVDKMKEMSETIVDRVTG